MTFDRNPPPIYSATELLQRASARTGFTPEEMEALLDCELDTDQLLNYITAVTSNRMN